MLTTISTILATLSNILDIIPIVEAIKSTIKSSPMKRLYNALDKDHSITTRAELYYQLKCYVPQNFKTIENEILPIKKILTQIKHSEGDLFAITGKPASGKTTSLRYLFYKLSKTHPCVYFQMKNVKDSDSLKKYLSDQKKINNINDNEIITAFFDGMDEALSFLQNEDFHSMFLKGTDSKIHQIFRENNLFLESMVFGIRPEFLNKSTHDLKFQAEKISMHIFETTRISDKEVIKIFKSMKTLMKMDKKYSKNKTRHLQKYSKYPKRGEERKYIKLLKKILKQNPDSLFHYPMYIRYAYAFMKEYAEQWNSDLENRAPENNMAISFHILVDAIMKWEFHVYYHISARNNCEMWQDFKNKMTECMNAVIETMLSDKTQNLSRERLLKILNSRVLPSEEEKESLPFAIAHCFMTSDEDGVNFEFCHFTFYEYFLSQYLIQKADYQTRLEYLMPEAFSENFEQMYYTFFCAEKDLNEKISGSIGNWDCKVMTLSECLELRKETIIIVENPIVSMREIYEYLPVIQSFSYRGLHYTQEQLEQIISSGVLDLAPTGWDRIQYAYALVPLVYIEELQLCGLPLKDVDTLENYSHLKRLDFRVHADSSSLVYDALRILRGFSLEWIYISTEDCDVFDEISLLTDKKELLVEKVFVDLPDYSKAYMKIYQFKQQSDQTNQDCRFYIKRRTNLQNAITEYKKNNSKKNHDILKAVFELEADESGELGLTPKNARATLWNGLSLGEYYYYLDWTDEDKHAYEIFSRIEPYILKDGKKLSVLFGKAFGPILTSIGGNKANKAKKWLTYVYEHAAEYLSEADTIDVSLRLYRARLRCWDTDLEEFVNNLEEVIKKLPDYEKDWKYLRYLQYNNVRALHDWKKGEQMPDEVTERNMLFQQAAKKYAEEKNRYPYLATALHYATLSANRAENTKEAANLLKDLEAVISKADEHNDDRAKQGNWIIYQEQKLYYLFLTYQNTEAINVIEALLNYEFRSQDKLEESYRYIQACIADENKQEQDIDQHKLWNTVWY